MKTCYKNIKLIDGTGREILDNAYLLVEDGIVNETGRGLTGDIGEGSNIVDLEGKYVMPGLIDSHVHIGFSPTADTSSFYVSSHTDFIVQAIRNLEALLKGGVTYIREVGGLDHLELGLRKYLMDGTIKGPGMLCAGKVITMTGGHGNFIGRESDGVDDVIRATREQLKAGADLIKIIATGGIITPGVDINAYQLNLDELTAAAKEAHKAGKKICTHCHGTQGIKNSIRAGIDSIEHATLMDEEAVDMAVKAGTYIVPTFSAMHFIVENGEKNGIPKYVVDKAKEVSKGHDESFRMAYEAGIKIAMGTDASTPFNVHGKSSAFELELMTRHGMSPMDAIVSATKISSELIGIEEKHGTLEAGKYADFLVLKENPLDNIKTIQDLVAVYQKGILIK